jgi:tRNA pseudouridine38-40 synthase
MTTARNIKAVIEYDGTLFKGWQMQPGTRTVQGEISGALAQILGHPVILHGSGRTDTGVHALCQIANFRTHRVVDLGRLMDGVNSLVGDDVRVFSLETAHDRFHARYSAVSRTYRYLFGTDVRTLSPFLRNRAWYIGAECDSAALMTDCCRSLIGTRDFRNLSKRDPERRDYMTIIFDARLASWELGLVLEVRAKRFLPQMMKRIAGTLVAIGRGTAPPDFLASLLDQPERPPAKVHMAPACGLYLAAVAYAPGMNGLEEEITSDHWRSLHEILH